MLVTKDIPPYAIAVGVPAVAKKYRFEEEKIKKLMEEKWWEKGIQSLRIEEIGMQVKNLSVRIGIFEKFRCKMHILFAYVKIKL